MMNDFDLFTGQVAEVDIVYMNRVKAKDRPVVQCSGDAQRIFRDTWSPGTMDCKEMMRAIYLSRSNKVMAITTLSSGSVSGTVCDPKDVFVKGLKVRACTVILCHNHPSGNLKPSEADLRLTKKIKQAGEFMEFPLLDHLIITSDGCMSLADENLM